ncbi:Chorismate mutase type II [Streptomyces sp. di188]|nr:Chorismate mutase type II [Streptomyces sp. di188]SCD41997.1 Chorismate mutase type II [Streptomyces sp. di50b]
MDVRHSVGEQGLRALRAGLDELGDLDGQIVALLLRRAELADRHRRLRLAAGLPAAELAWENQVLTRYGDRLGPRGTDIGRAVLALPRPGRRPAPRAEG